MNIGRHRLEDDSNGPESTTMPAAFNIHGTGDVGATAVTQDFILSATDIVRRFGGLVAVNGVSLQVRRGTIHALIGPNGAGKTTFFNIMTKFLPPTSGTIVFNGQDITGLTPPRVARLGMVRSFQISSVFPQLTVLENVRVALQRKRRHSFDFYRSGRALRPLDARAVELLLTVGLGDSAHLRAGALSYGRKRTLELATTLALDPEMLLLDEPMAGMGHEDIDRMTGLIRQIAVDRTILMVEHNLSVVASLSDEISVLARGQLIAQGDYKSISANPEVIEAYIGGVDADD